MSQAILIAGNCQRFSETTGDLRSFLVHESGAKVIREMRTAYGCDEFLTYRLERAFAKRTKEPLLLLYCGHGATDGWALDDMRRLPYERLTKLLAVGRRPVMIVNDCCHAMSLAGEFEAQKISPERVSLIAACDWDATTRGGLVDRLIACWRRGWVMQGVTAPDVPGRRWGAEHDRFFFAKNPAPP